MSAATRDAPAWLSVVALPLLNVALALLVGMMVVLAIGESPAEAAKILVWGAFGSSEAIGYTLYYATNLIFTGLAVAVAFQAGLFNIGGEGQAMLGGLGVGLLSLALDAYLPWWLLLPLVIVAAAAFGALWAVVPGWLQAYRGSHIVITTIMFNFIASALLVFMLVNVLIKPGSMAPETREFSEAGWMPLVHDVLGSVGLAVDRTPLNLSLIVALVAAMGVWLLLWRTRTGYRIRTVGLSADAARYGGISPQRITVITMAISGALAGMMAVNEVSGVSHRLTIDFVAGYGFTGIAVALMGRSHPVGIIVAALLFGALYQGGAELAFEIPTVTRDLVVVIQGLVILFCGALEFMLWGPLVAVFGRRRQEAST